MAGLVEANTSAGSQGEAAMLAVCEAFDGEWGQCRDGWSKPLRTSSGRAAGLEPDGRRAALAPAQRCSCPSPLTPLATLDPDAYFNQDAEALKALLADGAVMHAGMQACPGPACPCATPPPLLPGPHACPCCCCRAPSADCIVTEQDRVGPDQVARFFSKVRHSWAVGCLRQENDAHVRRPPAAAPLNFICALPTAPSPLQYFSNYKSTHFPVVRAVCEKTSSVYCLWDDEVSSRLDLTCQRADLSGGACSGRHHHIHSLAALLPSAPCCHPQNVIQRPESFDEELPAARSVTSVSGAAGKEAQHLGTATECRRGCAAACHAPPASLPPRRLGPGIWRLVLDQELKVAHIWFLRQLTREEKKHRVRAGHALVGVPCRGSASPPRQQGAPK